jgi:hypothetical protein
MPTEGALSLEIRRQEVAGQLSRRGASEIRRPIEARLQLDDARIDTRIARDGRLVIAAARREHEQEDNATHG